MAGDCSASRLRRAHRRLEVVAAEREVHGRAQLSAPDHESDTGHGGKRSLRPRHLVHRPPSARGRSLAPRRVERAHSRPRRLRCTGALPLRPLLFWNSERRSAVVGVAHRAGVRLARRDSASSIVPLPLRRARGDCPDTGCARRCTLWLLVPLARRPLSTADRRHHDHQPTHRPAATGQPTPPALSCAGTDRWSRTAGPGRNTTAVRAAPARKTAAATQKTVW